MKWGPAIVTIFILIVLFSAVSFDAVDASHKGVKVRFGRIQGTMDPGMEFTGPMVSVYPYDLRLRKMEVAMEGNQGAVDKDGQSVYARIEINYKLNPLSVQKIYSEVGRTLHRMGSEVRKTLQLIYQDSFCRQWFCCNDKPQGLSGQTE